MSNKTFGVPIDDLLKRSDGCEVPLIIKNIVEYLEKHGLSSLFHYLFCMRFAFSLYR